MTRATLASGIELEYDTFGSPDDSALLLVMGFTAQMILWNEEFCQRLADAGRYVIRFDNRDCGLSSKLDGVEVDTAAVLGAAMSGEPLPPVPYTLSDMAADAIGLLDVLGIERAHIAGASMGGMIVQTMAIEHPDRLLSVTSIMSTVGDRNYGAAKPEAMTILLTPPPAERDQVIERREHGDLGVEAVLRRDQGQGVRRHRLRPCVLPGGRSAPARGHHGVGRPQRRTARGVDADARHPRPRRHPDRPVGRASHRRAVPNAHLLEVADMGHDIPPPLYGLIVGAMIGHQESAVHPAVGAPLEAAS
ncbi:MAG: alpha/beta hydrolase [Ilumatobacteraceae bacterium]